MKTAIPPPRISTERLLLRCWTRADAEPFKRALDSSLPELQKWIPWTLGEPSALEEIEERLAGYRRDFFSGGNALYAIMDPLETEVLGGVGLYRRVGPGAIEIGYWTRSDLVGRGIATESAGLLTEAAAALSGIERIEIRCDPANVASTMVPKKLGYRQGGVVQADSPSPVTGRCDLVVWTRLTDLADGA